MTVTSYFRPASLPEALGLLETHGSSLLVVAGGTVAMPLINEGISLPAMVMGLRSAGLDRLEVVDGELRIGATVTLTRLLEQRFVPMLSEAAGATASWTVRNLATVGGNLFTPPPGGDVAVALLALDARVEVASGDRIRLVPLADFWTGFMTSVLGEDELVTGIRVPLSTGATSYAKFGRKHSNTPAVVTVAASARRDGERVTGTRIALGAAGPHPVRAHEAERIVDASGLASDAIAQAAAAAARGCEPFTDGVATEWYRRRMVRLFVERTLTRLAGSIAEGGR